MTKSKCGALMICSNKFSLSEPTSCYFETPEYSILQFFNNEISSTRANVYSFSQIDASTLNGWSEQIFMVKTDFPIFQSPWISSFNLNGSSFWQNRLVHPQFCTIIIFIAKIIFLELGEFLVNLDPDLLFDILFLIIRYCWAE